MNADSVLAVQTVSKKFCRHLKRSYVYGLQDIFCEVTGQTRHSDRLRDREFWSVRNVSIEVKKGQSIGIVGINGSGKSTLLRMISGLMKPDTGRIVVRGRIAALIALGAGFNPLLSGRENVFINMAILGLSQADIQARFKDVVDFAEVWEAIESPVRTYSSGMRARLGFACAVFTYPDILLLDEVLAVGDTLFRTKCYRKLALLREQGTSFFLVSHNSNAILNLCDDAVFLHRGRIIMQGRAEEVIERYEQSIGKKSFNGKSFDSASFHRKSANRKLFNRKNEKQQDVGVATINSTVTQADCPDIQGHTPIRFSIEKRPPTELTIESVSFVDDDHKPTPTLASGQPATLSICCRVHEPIHNAIVTLLIRTPNAGNDCVLNIDSNRDQKVLQLQPGLQEIRLHFPQFGLRPQSYFLKITISRQPFYVFDMVGPFEFEVKSGTNMNQCQFYQPRQWQLPSSHVVTTAQKPQDSYESRR